MIGNQQWGRYIHTIEVESNKKVKEIEFNIVASNFQGEINFTDLQFQEGKSISGYVPETRDVLEPVRFTIDENAFLNTVTNSVKLGNKALIHKNVSNRFYNIVGRGHEVVSIPNVFHEDYTFPLVTTGLDIEIRAKEDFDLLRIRTNDGNLIEGRKYSGIPELANHPLNYRYTREFYFDGAKAGELIELRASIRSAKVNGKNIPLKKGKIDVKGKSMNIDRQRFMLAPSGSFRLGIEFYKQVTKSLTNENGTKSNVTYLEDVGIGYYGIAELNQWTYGVSKL